MEAVEGIEEEMKGKILREYECSTEETYGNGN